MLKNAVRALLIAAFFYMIAFYFFSDELEDLVGSDAVERQIDVICRQWADGVVTKDELCGLPITEIPGLAKRYQAIRKADADWYARRGSAYYPAVYCVEQQVLFRLLGQAYRCRDGGAEEIEP